MCKLTRTSNSICLSFCDLSFMSVLKPDNWQLKVTSAEHFQNSLLKRTCNMWTSLNRFPVLVNRCHNQRAELEGSFLYSDVQAEQVWTCPGRFCTARSNALCVMVTRDPHPTPADMMDRRTSKHYLPATWWTGCNKNKILSECIKVMLY